MHTSRNILGGAPARPLHFKSASGIPIYCLLNGNPIKEAGGRLKMWGGVVEAGALPT